MNPFRFEHIGIVSPNEQAIIRAIERCINEKKTSEIKAYNRSSAQEMANISRKHDASNNLIMDHDGRSIVISGTVIVNRVHRKWTIVIRC